MKRMEPSGTDCHHYLAPYEPGDPGATLSNSVLKSKNSQADRPSNSKTGPTFLFSCIYRMRSFWLVMMPCAREKRVFAYSEILSPREGTKRTSRRCKLFSEPIFTTPKKVHHLLLPQMLISNSVKCQQTYEIYILKPQVYLEGPEISIPW